MKRTKIICTMGPSTSDKKVIRSLIENGMNIARFNFSHGTHESQLEMLKKVREVSDELQIPVATLLDTKGPEIRTGLLADGNPIFLEEGKDIILTTKEIAGNTEIISVNYAGLIDDVNMGDRILIDDGLLEVIVEKKLNDNEILCKIMNGGKLGERKGVNIPGVSLNFPVITDKDREDILFGIENDFDFIAASFVRSKESILAIKEILNDNDFNIPVISKVECLEAVENLEEVLDYSDGIMIARGDLGVEIPAAQVPFMQKKIIKECHKKYKPVIVATQMLDSMIRNPRPTRAEVNDVANAIYEGTDCVMLSGETANGKYPVEAIQTMKEICETTEEHIDFSTFAGRHKKFNYSSAVSESTVNTADNIGAKLIVTPTISGTTARCISRFRPSCLHIGVSPNMKTVRRMQLYWGVIPYWEQYHENASHIIQGAIDIVRARGLIESGDVFIVTSGMASNYRGTRHDDNCTNTIRVFIAD